MGQDECVDGGAFVVSEEFSRAAHSLVLPVVDQADGRRVGDLHTHNHTVTYVMSIKLE